MQNDSVMVQSIWMTVVWQGHGRYSFMPLSITSSDLIKGSRIDGGLTLMLLQTDDDPKNGHAVFGLLFCSCTHVLLDIQEDLGISWVRSTVNIYKCMSSFSYLTSPLNYLVWGVPISCLHCSLWYDAAKDSERNTITNVRFSLHMWSIKVLLSLKSLCRLLTETSCMVLAWVIQISMHEAELQYV